MENCNSCDNQNNSTNIPDFSKFLFAPLPENMLLGVQTNQRQQRTSRFQRRRTNRNQAPKNNK